MARKKNPAVAQESPKEDQKEKDSQNSESKKVVFDPSQFSTNDLLLHNKFYKTFSNHVWDDSGELCTEDELKRPDIGYLVAAALLRVAADIFLNLKLDFNAFANLSDNMFVFEQKTTVPFNYGTGCTCDVCTAAKSIVDDAYKSVGGDFAKLSQDDVANIINKIEEKAKEFKAKSDPKKGEDCKIPINTKIPKNTLN